MTVVCKPTNHVQCYAYGHFLNIKREAEFQDEARNSRESSAERCFAMPASGVKGVKRGEDRKGARRGIGEGSLGGPGGKSRDKHWVATHFKTHVATHFKKLKIYLFRGRLGGLPLRGSRA